MRRMMLVGLAMALSPCGCKRVEEATAPRAAEPLVRAPRIHTRDVPSDPAADALSALARDARARELRFMEALRPGYTLSSTRITGEEVSRGAWSAKDLYDIGGVVFSARLSESPLRRVHRGDDGGPDARGCSNCHWRGGPAGAGDAADNAYLRGDGDRPRSGFERNPVSLAGAGWVQLVAEHLTRELRRQRDEAITFARDKGYAVRVELVAAGISFGRLTADPNGSVDTRELSGVDPDLTVRPFGWKGHFESLRDIIEVSLRIHHGVSPDDDRLSAGQITALVSFVALQGIPISTMPRDPQLAPMVAAGQTRFAEIGCAQCHVPKITVGSPELRVEGLREPLNLAVDGAHPRNRRSTTTGELEVWLYSDLKRHAMGPALAERAADGGVPADQFRTPPLWGLSRSKPYLHDGRTAELEEAILLHGGEAQPARDAYEALPEHDRAQLRVFVTTLTRGRRMVVP